MTHQASHFTYHMLHNNLYVLQNNNDHNIGALQQLIKIDPEEVCPMFFDENHGIDNINA